MNILTKMCSVRSVDLENILASFFCAINVIEGITYFSSDLYLFLILKALGSAPLAPVTRISPHVRLYKLRLLTSFGSRGHHNQMKFLHKKRRRSSGLVVSKKRRRLLPFNPSEDPATRLEQIASFGAALKAIGAAFSNELTYPSRMAPRSSNRAILEREGMQIMSKEDIETMNSCKCMMEIGQWPPLMVVYYSREGFTVQADRSIRDFTIITEYVDFLEKKQNYTGDSMMTLICASDPSKNLVICPEKQSNIARFINGINNHTQ